MGGEVVLGLPADEPGELVDLPGRVGGGDQLEILSLPPEESAGVVEYAVALHPLVDQAGEQKRLAGVRVGRRGGRGGGQGKRAGAMPAVTTRTERA